MQNSTANKNTSDARTIIVITAKLLVISVITALMLALVNGLTKDINEINNVYSGNIYIGYVAEVAPKGFGGEITLMVGVNANGGIVGVKVISHKETAGLGSRVSESEYLTKYLGANGETIDSVDTISGATISSKAVRSGVADAISVYESVVPDGGAK